MCIIATPLVLFAVRQSEITRRYYLLGERQARYDVEHNVYYVYNNFGMPFVANVHNQADRHLIWSFWSAGIADQNRWLSAYADGYRLCRTKLTGSSIITTRPLIDTYYMLIDEGVIWKGRRLPSFHDDRELCRTLQSQDPMLSHIDPYSGSGIRYGINREFTKRPIDALGSDRNTLLLWEDPLDKGHVRHVEFCNGRISLVTAKSFYKLESQQNVR